jgi:conjugal transfer pilus assembly protein TraB
MKDRIMTFWGEMNGKQRRLVVWIGGSCLFLIIFFIGSTVMNRNTPQQSMPKDAHVLNIEGDMLAKSKAMENLKVVADRDSKVAELTKQLDEITREKSSQTAASQQQNNSNQPLPQPNPADIRERIAGNSPGRSQKGSSPTFPAPPIPQGSTAMFPPPPSGSSGQGTQMPPPDTEIGDIAIVSSQVVTKSSKAADEDKKKDQRKVYLPPSFMEATLLSGLDAPTTSDAKGNPVPVLIRIKTPAVLPNSVKANLKGCFVIADGKGNLSTERAELVLVSLSCLDRKGQAVVDQKIKGFVVDEDGKIGLRGKVVSKMGSLIARSMIAGFFGGTGDAIKASATTTAISPLGSTQVIDAKNIGIAGAGAGLSNAFKEIEKFYHSCPNV